MFILAQSNINIIKFYNVANNVELVDEHTNPANNLI